METFWRIVILILKLVTVLALRCMLFKKELSTYFSTDVTAFQWWNQITVLLLTFPLYTGTNSLLIFTLVYEVWAKGSFFTLQSNYNNVVLKCYCQFNVWLDRGLKNFICPKVVTVIFLFGLLMLLLHIIYYLQNYSFCCFYSWFRISLHKFETDDWL